MDRFRNTGQPDWDWWGRIWPTPGETLRRLGLRPGDRVEQGQEIGRCGHSGNSSEPHLHFHVQDYRIPYVGAGLPVQFVAATDHPDLSRCERAKTYLHCGQTVTSDPQPDV